MSITQERFDIITREVNCLDMMWKLLPYDIVTKIKKFYLINILCDIKARIINIEIDLYWCTFNMVRCIIENEYNELIELTELLIHMEDMYGQKIMADNEFEKHKYIGV